MMGARPWRAGRAPRAPMDGFTASLAAIIQSTIPAK
jgi:hypothetical protein